jgi:hypothetical protein
VAVVRRAAALRGGGGASISCGGDRCAAGACVDGPGAGEEVSEGVSDVAAAAGPPPPGKATCGAACRAFVAPPALGNGDVDIDVCVWRAGGPRGRTGTSESDSVESEESLPSRPLAICGKLINVNAAAAEPHEPHDRAPPLFLKPRPAPAPAPAPVPAPCLAAAP